jgi:hypothetical protein
MMTPMRRIPLLAAVLALAVAACTGSSPASGSPASGSPSTPAASVASGSPAGRSPGTSPGGPRPSPSISLVTPHEDPGLEARLPDEVDGKKLMKLSEGPVSTLGRPGAQAIKDTVKQIGNGSGDWGLAYAGDPNGTFNLFGLRIQGAEPAALLTSFAQLTVAETPGGKVESDTLAGRSLVHVVSPTSQIGDVWFYADGDTLLGVQAGSSEEATDLLALIK